jgi:hypothetical protein
MTNDLHDVQSFARSMRKLAAEEHRLRRDQNALVAKAARDERARRQFLSFLWFFILAASVILRERIDRGTSAIYHWVADTAPTNPLRNTKVMAEERINAVNEEVASRLDVLDQIYGENSVDAAADRSLGDSNLTAKAKLAGIAKEAERRQAILAELNAADWEDGVRADPALTDPGVGVHTRARAITNWAARRRDVLDTIE